MAASFFNQALSSGITFILSLYLIRELTTEAFGLYSAGISATLLYLGMGNALLLTPMVVQAPLKAHRGDFAGRILLLAILLSGCTAVLVVILFSVWSQLAVSNANNFAFVVATVFTAIAYLLRDFFVRYSFSTGNTALAPLLNLVVAALLTTILAIYSFAGRSITATLAMSVLGAAIFCGVAVANRRTNLPRSNPLGKAYKADRRELWRDGKWSLVGVFIVWAQSQSFVYLSAMFLGMQQLGHATAARVFTTPILFALPAMAQIMLPKLAEMGMGGARKLLPTSILITGVMLCVSAIYGFLLYLSSDSLAKFTQKDLSVDFESLIQAWCLAMFCQVFRDGASNALLALRQFRFITIANAFTLVPSLLLAAYLIRTFSVAGAILGTALGEFLLGCILWLKLFNMRQK